MFYVSLLFLLSLFCCPMNLTATSSSSSDVVALLSFKSLITHDPYEALSSWEWGGGNCSLHFCQWRGVTCNIKHRGQLRVTALDLQALDLAGPISPSLSNLTFLQRLHLPENQLSGPIPKELGLLSNLRHLNLTFNLLQEYGVASKVSTEGDVYSYGIMLLEMFTGRRPTEEIFKEGLSLHRFVEMALPNMVPDVLDPMLYSTEEGVEAASYVVVQKRNLTKQEMDCITTILNIGISCSKDSPIERMQMSDALNDLQTIRNAFFRATNASESIIHISGI